MIQLRAGSATDVGLVRTNNQDRLLVAGSLFAVADGMGGAAAGEVASATAVQGLLDAFNGAGDPTPQSLLQAARSANRAVWEQAEANPEMRGMGTTLVALALVGEGRLAAVNIGDSRLYLLRGDDFRQVTSDHNLVAELVAEGRISKEEAEVHPRRNIMTRALGVDPDVDVDLFVEDPMPGDRYLLCSDGLPRELRDEHIASLLRRLAEPQEAAKELVDEAKRRGGNDNITAVVVDIVSSVTAAGGSGDTAAGGSGDNAAGGAGDNAAGGSGDTAAGGADAGAVSSTATVSAAAAAADEAEPMKPTEGEDDQTIAFTAPSPTRPETEDVAPAPTRDHRDRKPEPKKPQAKMITLRVVGFFVLLLVILGIAAAGIAWYARSSYFVGLRGDRVTIFQGRPGGVLWFQPTIASRTNLTTAGVLAHEIPKLRAGQEEATLSDARHYVANLIAEANAARSSQSANTTVPSGTVTPGTTGPPATT